MPVESAIYRVQYATNGTTGPWTIPFYFLADEDVLVVYTDATGEEFTLVLDVDYTLTGEGVESGGTATTTTAYASGGFITIRRDPELLQPEEFQDADRFPAAALNRGLDRLTMMAQATRSIVDRAIVFSETDGAGVTLPTADVRANRILAFNSAGEITMLAGVDASSAAALQLDIENSDNSVKGDALVGVKSTLTYAVATTQHEVNERMRNVFDWLTTSEKAAVIAGTATDITTNVQRAIDSGESLFFPRGYYHVTKLTFDGIGKTYYFNGAQIFGLASSAQMGLIDWKASYCTVYNMALFCQWIDDYTSAMYWHSASAILPAQSNRFFGLSIDNSLIGILYGEVSPTSPVDAPQSENFIYGFRSRGTEQPIYCNQSNGFLQVDGEITAARNEWEINNPGVYSYTDACCINVLQGVVRARGEFIKADTQLGVGLRNSGGILEVSGVIEIACQVFAGSGGATYMHDVTFGYWANASVSWAALSGTSGTLRISDLVLNKAVAAASANTAFVELGTATGWNISLSDCRLENQLNTIFSNGSGQAHMWTGDNVLSFQNVTSLPVSGGTTPTFPKVSTFIGNLLDLRGTDTIGNDIATWYKRDVTGTGAIALDTDIPTSSNYFNSVMVTPAVTTGRSGVYSADVTSLTTVKATAIKCRPGETYMLSGWFRMTTSGTANVSALFINTAGTPQQVNDLITQAQLLTSSWRYLTVMFVVPALSAYLGVGIEGVSGTVCRMAGLRVARLGHEP